MVFFYFSNYLHTLHLLFHNTQLFFIYLEYAFRIFLVKYAFGLCRFVFFPKLLIMFHQVDYPL